MEGSVANPFTVESSSSERRKTRKKAISVSSSSPVSHLSNRYSMKSSSQDSLDDVPIGRARFPTKAEYAQLRKAKRPRRSPSPRAPSPASNYAEELYRDGVTVVCLPVFAARVAALRAELEQEFLRFPEFLKTAPFAALNSKNPVRYGLGGTSFVGSPSVFHNMFARNMRQHVMHELIPLVFRPLARLIGGDLFLHQLIDRMMVRPKGETGETASWHRDVAPGSSGSDHTFGGWINLDLENQYLIAVKGTHITPPGSKIGFSTIAKTEHPRYKAELQAQAGSKGTDGRGYIVVPPGCIIIFDEKIVHAVEGSAAKSTRVRQFLGWRLTENEGSTGMVDPHNRPYARDQVLDLMRRQAVIPLKSGQVPPMYPGVYQSFAKASLVVWEKFERENILPGSMQYPKEARKGNSTKQNGDYTRSMKSLAEIAPDRMHPRYAENELELLFPGKTFHLKNPTTGKIDIVKL